MKTFELLSRSEMRNVRGGYIDPPASCTASCTSPHKDVTCDGTNCQATDGEGCTAFKSDGTEDKKNCYNS